MKKYRTMLTTDRGAFDKEATRFLRNLRGQRGKARGGGSCVTAANIKAAWQKKDKSKGGEVGEAGEA